MRELLIYPHRGKVACIYSWKLNRWVEVDLGKQLTIQFSFIALPQLYCTSIQLYWASLNESWGRHFQVSNCFRICQSNQNLSRLENFKKWVNFGVCLCKSCKERFKSCIAYTEPVFHSPHIQNSHNLSQKKKVIFVEP